MLRPYGASVTDAVEFFIKHCKPVRGDISISGLMKEFQTVKTSAGLSSKYLDTARNSFFAPFRDHFKDCLITQVTKDQCQKYVYGHGEDWNATTIATHIRHLNVLYNFAIECGYATLNPFQKVQRPKKLRSRSKEKVMKVEAVRMYLQFALDQNLTAEVASLVLVFFCGVRIDEVERVKWSDIRFDESTPVVLIEEPKVAHQRRVNSLPSNAIAWLEIVKGKGRTATKKILKATEKVAPQNYAESMRNLRERFRTHLTRQSVLLKLVGKVGTEYVRSMDYKQNSARISFASYHAATFEDPSQTSLLLGHQNPALLWNTYRALVPKSEAERYWNIYPNRDSANIQSVTDENATMMRMKRIAKAVASV